MTRATAIWRAGFRWRRLKAALWRFFDAGLS
jgi:hypothetical protein